MVLVIMYNLRQWLCHFILLLNSPSDNWSSGSSDQLKHLVVAHMVVNNCKSAAKLQTLCEARVKTRRFKLGSPSVLNAKMKKSIQAGGIQSKSSTCHDRAQCMHQREATVCLPMRESSTLIWPASSAQKLELECMAALQQIETQCCCKQINIFPSKSTLPSHSYTYLLELSG